MFLAEQAEVVGSEAVTFEISFALYGKNGSDFIFLELLDVSCRFRITSYKNMRSYL